jgi:DNA-binding CsgD family transcriptional regulator
MGRRRAANDPSVRVELSDRQRQVLDLIARGATNAQIAERLGITLDGAKWHVREILSRLGVETREEAADWWRSSGRWPRMPAWIPRGPWPVGIAATLVAGVAATAISAAVLRSPTGETDVTSADAADVVPSPTPHVELVPELPQPPLKELDAGPGWRLLVADDGRPMPGADEAVLAINWDLATPYLDVLDVDGRVAMRVEVGYRPMARINLADGTFVVSDIPLGAEAARRNWRVLVFALDPPAFAGEVALAGTRSTSTVFANRVAVSADGRWLYWVERSVQTDPPSCASGGDAAICDRMVIHAIDLTTLGPADLEAEMPRGCGAPHFTPYGPSAVLAGCYSEAGGFVLDASVPGSAISDAPEGAPLDAWNLRTAPGATVALRLSIASDGAITRMDVVDRATSRVEQRYVMDDAWEVHLLDSDTALVLRSSGRLERMDLATGDGVQLPYRIAPGNQGLDIALVR